MYTFFSYPIRNTPLEKLSSTFQKFLRNALVPKGCPTLPAGSVWISSMEAQGAHLRKPKLKLKRSQFVLSKQNHRIRGTGHHSGRRLPQYFWKVEESLWSLDTFRMAVPSRDGSQNWINLVSIFQAELGNFLMLLKITVLLNIFHVVRKLSLSFIIQHYFKFIGWIMRYHPVGSSSTTSSLLDELWGIVLLDHQALYQVYWMNYEVSSGWIIKHYIKIIGWIITLIDYTLPTDTSVQKF